MKILIEAHHPAHIHFWKFPVKQLQEAGHTVLMIARDRDVMKRLLTVYNWIPSEIPKRILTKNRFPLLEMLQRQWAIARAIRHFKPDVVASLMGSYTQSAKLFGVRNVIFTDSEFQHFNHRIAHPFADVIYTPECFYKELGPKHVRYKGIHELSFITSGMLKTVQESDQKPSVLIRLSAWNTLHDISAEGVGRRIYAFVERFKDTYEIIISAEEGAYPEGLESYAIKVTPEHYHETLAQSAFVLTEGASTASEAACLGVPCVYINSTEPRGYLEWLGDEYELVDRFTDPTLGMERAVQMLSGLDNALQAKHMNAVRRLHAAYPDVSQLIAELVCAE
jgi:predicted glycosyltransferase